MDNNINNDNIITDPDIFQNDIDLYIKLFCEEQNISDLKTESQNVFNACLMYVYRKLFRNTNILKNNNSFNNHNVYNLDILNTICDYYIFICGIYDKDPSIMGYCYLTGINYDTIMQWNHDAGTDKLTANHSDIYQKLSKARENSLAGMLTGGKRNPVGVLGVLNHFYAWNMPGVRETAPKVARIGRDDTQTAINGPETAPLLPGNNPQDADTTQ